MADRIRLALIAGGSSGEREVSLAGAAGVLKALDPEKYAVRSYDPACDLAALAGDAGELDVALLLLHGLFGEDGTMQGFLDMLGLPYQGAGVLGSALAMDKNIAKILYRRAGLTVPAWKMASPADLDNPAVLAAELGLPLVIKPLRQGSSIGISIAGTEEELLEGLLDALRHDTRVMVEEYIAGREITGGVIGNRELTALPLVEIIPAEGHSFFDYAAKYDSGAATREVCPAELSPELTARARECALLAHRTLMLSDYSRTDMIVNNEGIYLLETNTIPGMTKTSLFPQAARVHGLDFAALLDRLVELALEKGRG